MPPRQGEGMMASQALLRHGAASSPHLSHDKLHIVFVYLHMFLRFEPTHFIGFQQLLYLELEVL